MRWWRQAAKFSRAPPPPLTARCPRPRSKGFLKKRGRVAGENVNCFVGFELRPEEEGDEGDVDHL